MNLHAARELLVQLMTQHNLTGWRFGFDRSVSRFGCCRYREKLISLSAPLVELNSEEEVRDTILHEIAHALTPGHQHDNVWKLKCVEIGAKPVRCYDRSVVEPPAPWRGRCPEPQCATTVKRHKMPRSTWQCSLHKATLVWEYYNA